MCFGQHNKIILQTKLINAIGKQNNQKLNILVRITLQYITLTTSTFKVIQKRLNGFVDFYRGWDAYKNGFGDPAGEYWLGIDHILFL